MHKTLITIITLCVATLGVCAQAWAAENGRTLVLQLTGKDTGETRPVPPVAGTGTREGNCFDVDLYDMLADKAIGTATRCFADITTVGNGMVVTETTFLRLPNGTLVSRSRTTIQPALESSPEVTHIAVAAPDSEATAILTDASSGAFQGTSGRVRLAGAMDMRQFRARNELVFDDLMVIQLVDRDIRVSQAQKHLQAAGLYDGALDGVLGPRMRQALRQYQAKHGLPSTGELDDATRKALSSP